jgi:hypothetical protein
MFGWTLIHGSALQFAATCALGCECRYLHLKSVLQAGFKQTTPVSPTVGSSALFMLLLLVHLLHPYSDLQGYCSRAES